MPRSRGVGVCAHCQSCVNLYDKGLCWSCVSNDEVRGKALPLSKFGRRGRGLRGVGNHPPFSTRALPGTEEKIRVMELRASLGCSLFHEDDPSERTRKRTTWIDRGVSFED